MVNESIDEYWENKGLNMQTEAKRQRTAERKRKKREVKRESHLKQRYGAQAMKEHDRGMEIAF